MSGASETPTGNKASAAIREEAAEWLIRLTASDVTQAEHIAFATWLKRSPVHLKEYLHAEATWSVLGDATRLDTSDVQALLREAGANVVPLQSARETAAAAESGARAHPVTSRRRMFRFTRVASVAAAVAAIGVGLFFFSPALIERLRTDTYTTGIGEQRRLVLPDGSAIELNTRSRIDVLYSDTAREVTLRQGEALFTVAKDRARPFRVHSGTAAVRAVGTQFNVYRQPDQTIVTVLEGRVAIERRMRGDEPARDGPFSAGADVSLDPVAVELSAGEVAEIPLQPQPKVVNAKASPARATAWRQRRLIFDDAPLADVVTEFNRYNVQQIVIENPTIAGERISGVFDADRPDALARFLTLSGEVCYRTTQNGGFLEYCK